MPNQVEPKLIQPLFDTLQNERFVTLATIDYETGSPIVSSLSWIWAKNETSLYFAVESRSRIVQNIKANREIAINVIANETTYSIYGNAVVKQEILDAHPLKLALLEVAIREVRDVMFYGSKIVQEPKHNKIYDQDAAAKLDYQVMDALKKA